MPKYLVQVSLNKDGIRDLLTNAKGTGLRAAVAKFAESAGGRLDTYYFAFGQHDVVAIIDFPDNISAAALSVAANGTGAVDLAMTPLIAPEEMDRAVEKSATLAVSGRP
jgi:uncharacterized protein with GYD domain